MINSDWSVAARGVWFYDGTVPRTIEVYASPAKLAGSRLKEPDDDTAEGDVPNCFVLDESAPIPDTPDGFVYYVGATSGGEFHSLEQAKTWADAQPWGPMNWE